MASKLNRKTRKLLLQIERQIRDASMRFELLLNIYGSRENLTIINRVAPNVFLLIRNALLETIVIGLNRLCDPSQDSRGNKNLSIERLRLFLPKNTKKNKILYDEILELENKIKREVGKLNKFRSKRIAHSDYHTHARNWYRKIQNSAIDRSLKMMAEIVSKIYLHFDNASVHILDVIYPLGDGPDRLMSQLKRSLDRQ
jgi:hypothetical protein